MSLGQALCKLLPLADISIIVSVQNLVLIAVDRFGAVMLSLRSPLSSSKLCSFFILTRWIVAMTVISPYLIVLKIVEYLEKLKCQDWWNEAFGESSSLAMYCLALYVVFLYVPIALLVILYSIIVIKLKTDLSR